MLHSQVLALNHKIGLAENKNEEPLDPLISALKTQPPKNLYVLYVIKQMDITLLVGLQINIITLEDSLVDFLLN